ncbi:MAG: ABC transporter substrate-binding protein [Ruminococcus sp.]|nr:ABC transporter substrate-binding protein [Ruminococcus sp.]
MKKFYTIFLTIAISLCSCSSFSKEAEQSLTDNEVLTEELSVASETEPQSFKETGISLSQNESVGNFFISNDSAYVLTSEVSKIQNLTVDLFDIESQSFTKIDTKLTSSYVIDICCMNDMFAVCYENSDGNNLSLLNYNGEIINTENLGYSLKDINMFYTNEKLILQGFQKSGEYYSAAVKIYNKNLEVISDKTDICSVTGYELSAISGVYDSGLDMYCVDVDKSEIKFMNTSSDFERKMILPVDFALNIDDLCAAHTLHNGNLLIGFCDYENNVTYYDEYSRSTGELINTYELARTENTIIPGNDKYSFFYQSSDGFYGILSTDGTKEKIIDEKINDDEVPGTYNVRYDNINNRALLFNNYNPCIQRFYKIEEDKLRLIFENDNENTVDFFVTEDNRIYSLYRDEKSHSEYYIEEKSSDGLTINNISFDCFNDKQIYDFCVDSSQNIFFISRNESNYIISKFTKEGKLISETDLPDIIDIHTMYTDESGNVNIYANSMEGNAVYQIIEDTIKCHTFNEYMRFNFLHYCPSPPSDCFTFYDGDGIYSYSYQTKEIVRIVNWKEYSSNCSMSIPAILNQDSIIYCGTDYVSMEETISLMERSDEIEDRIIINIAEVGRTNDKIRSIVHLYNRTSEKYKIELTSYKDQRSLDEDMGKGKVPDIVSYIIGTEFDIKRYIDNGYIAELDGYFDNDKSLNDRDYYLDLLRADNGKIYQTASSAGICYMKSNDEKQNFSDLSYDKIFELSDKKRNDLFSGVSSQEIIENFICDYVYQNIDYENMSFEPDDKILCSMFEIAKSCFEKKYDNTNEIKSGLSFGDAGDFLTLSENKIMTYPDGSYHINLLGCMLIMENSEHKDEGWNIIKKLLEEEHQSSYVENYSGFPLKKSSFQKNADYQNKNAERYDYSCFDDDFIEKVSEILETGKVSSYGCSTVNSIIDKAFEEYVNSNKSSRKIVEKVKADIKRYLDEN